MKTLSLYKEGEYQASSSRPFWTRLKSRSHANGHEWVTHVCIDENPVMRGTRSLRSQDVSKNCLALCAGLVKGNGSNNHRAMAYYRVAKTSQQIRSVEISFSLRWYVELIL